MKKKIYKKSKTPGNKLNRYPNIQIYRRQMQMKNSGTKKCHNIQICRQQIEMKNSEIYLVCFWT
jgi:hypothetical protein